MKKTTLLIGLLSLYMLCALPSAAMAEKVIPIKLGAVKIYPALAIGEQYNDNILIQQTKRKSSWMTTINPSLKVVAEKGSKRLEVNYRSSKGIYHGSRGDDFIDNFAGLIASFKPTSRLNINTWVNYNQAHDSRGATFSGLAIQFKTPDRYHETSVGSEVTYGIRARINVRGQYSHKRYVNHYSLTQARDLDTTGGRVLFSYPVTPKTSIAFESRYKNFNYKLLTSNVNLDSNELRYLVGLDWAATAKTTGTVRVGYVQKVFSHPRMRNAYDLSWEVNVLWNPLSYSSWDLSTSSMPMETDGTGSYIKDTRVNLTWKHEWSSRFSHHASVGFSRNVYKGGRSNKDRKDKITTASLGLDYQFRRWLSIGPEYDYTNRRSNTSLSSYRQNIWLLTLHGSL